MSEYLTWQKRDELPEIKRATSLYDAWADKARLEAGHARFGLLYAIKVTLLEPEQTGYSAEQRDRMIEDELARRIRPQFRAAFLEQLQSIVTSARLAR